MRVTGRCAIQAMGIAIAVLYGCSSLEERVGEKIEYMLPVQQAQPGDVIGFNFKLPPEIASGYVTFLKHTYRLFPRNDLNEFIYTAFLPVPLPTPPGEIPIACTFTLREARREIHEVFPLQIIARSPAPGVEQVRNREFNSSRYDQEMQSLANLAANASFNGNRLQTFLLPLGGQIKTRYGQERSYNGKSPMRLAGIEIEPLAHGNAWDVTAAGEGEIILAQKMSMLGNTVVIDHGFSMVTLYAHLHSLAVKAGGHVVRGAVLGRAGRTGGAAVGNRLRFQLLVAGVAVDVQKYMDIVTH